MKIENVWFFLGITAIMLIVVYGQKSLRDSYLNKITKALQDNDFITFDKYLNSFIVKLLFDPFNLCYMRLNAAFTNEDKDRIDKALKEFEYIDLSNKQKENVYSKGFNYYMSIEDYDNAKIYVDKINAELGKLPVAKQSQTIYDIYANKSGNHLDYLLETLKDTPLSERGFVEMLISDSYKNLNDEKNAKKYKDLSIAHFKALENEIRKGNKNGKTKSAKR